MAAGHIADGSTFALWRMNETTAYSTLIANSAGTPNFTAAGQSITKGPAGIGQYARRFAASNTAQPLTGTPTSTQRTAAVGSWTMAFWLKVHDLSALNYVVSLAGTVGDGIESQNYLLQVNTAGHVGNTFRMATFWESAGGDDHSYASITPLDLNIWYHVAVRKTVASDVTIDFFIEGLLDNTIVVPLSENTSGGSAAIWNIGRNGQASGPYGGFSVSGLKYSNIPRTDGEILADATSPTKTHSVDGNTLALWHFNEPPAAIDEVGGYHMIPTSGAPASVDALISDGGRAKYFDASGDVLSYGWDTDVIAFWRGQWTVETWFRMGDGNAAERSIIGYAGDFNVEPAEIGNYQVYISILANGKIRVYWETTSGADIDFNTTFALSASQLLEKHHLGIRKRLVSANAYQIDVYVDGLFVESSASTYPAPVGGTHIQSLGNNFMIGGGGGNSPTRFFGRIDDMRLSFGVRTDAEILESYNRGRTPFELILIIEEDSI